MITDILDFVFLVESLICPLQAQQIHRLLYVWLIQVDVSKDFWRRRTHKENTHETLHLSCPKPQEKH